jgi:antitoxin YefM
VQSQSACGQARTGSGSGRTDRQASAPPIGRWAEQLTRQRVGGLGPRTTIGPWQVKMSAWCAMFARGDLRERQHDAWSPPAAHSSAAATRRPRTEHARAERIDEDAGGEHADDLVGPPRAWVYPIAYTQRMAKHVPVREFRSRLSEFLSDVADRRDHILVTRNGKPAAALVPIDEYQALEETAEILSDADAMAAIEAGLADLNRGDTVTLDTLRAELAERRRAR